MTGPEHYREAETNLNAAARASDRGRPEDATFWLASAQIHATLALAAATALMQPVAGMIPVAEYRGWVEAAAEPEASATEAGKD